MYVTHKSNTYQFISIQSTEGTGDILRIHIEVP